VYKSVLRQGRLIIVDLHQTMIKYSFK